MKNSILVIIALMFLPVVSAADSTFRIVYLPRDGGPGKMVFWNPQDRTIHINRLQDSGANQAEDKDKSIHVTVKDPLLIAELNQIQKLVFNMPKVATLPKEEIGRINDGWSYDFMATENDKKVSNLYNVPMNHGRMEDMAAVGIITKLEAVLKKANVPSSP